MNTLKEKVCGYAHIIKKAENDLISEIINELKLNAGIKIPKDEVESALKDYQGFYFNLYLTYKELEFCLEFNLRDIINHEDPHPSNISKIDKYDPSHYLVEVECTGMPGYQNDTERDELDPSFAIDGSITEVLEGMERIYKELYLPYKAGLDAKKKKKK